MSELKCDYATYECSATPGYRGFVRNVSEHKSGLYHGKVIAEHGEHKALIEDEETGQMLVIDFELVKIVRFVEKSLSIKIAEHFTIKDLVNSLSSILDSAYIIKGSKGELFVSSDYNGSDLDAIASSMMSDPSLAVFARATKPEMCRTKIVNGEG